MPPFRGPAEPGAGSDPDRKGGTGTHRWPAPPFRTNVRIIGDDVEARCEMACDACVTKREESDGG